jgi:penicillin amidase
MILTQETILVAGGESQEITIRSTRHGPILSDFDQDLSAFSESWQDETFTYALSFRWNANEPSTILRGVRNLHLATNWEEFRNALRDWDIAPHNVLYADVEGNIGYQSPGRIPIRASGTGNLPVPGWTNDYEWIDYIPFDQLPSSFNPEEGFITTANNAVIGPTYPNFISMSWDYGYRAERINILLGEKPIFSIEDMQRIQGDNYNPMGPILLPYLRELTFEESKFSERLSLLNGWNYQNDMDSSPAALFNAIWRHVNLRTYADDLPLDWLPQTSRSFLVMESLVMDPTNDWWDDRRTPRVETRDDILQLAVIDAVHELEELLGEDPYSWTWGDLHGSSFINQVLGQSGIGLIEGIFNRGPFPTAGGESIVNATGWDYAGGYGVDWLPSHRMIVDLSDLGNSLSIHTTGQSGHAYHPHYIDMAELWTTIQYHPMLWTRDQVRTAVETHMKLRP